MALAKLVNLTGHPLTLTDGTKIVTLPSSGRARVESKKKKARRIIFDGLEIEIINVFRDQITGLPDPQEGVIYVVSGIVADTADREDVVAPGGLIRDNGNGRVKGCRNFIRVIK